VNFKRPFKKAESPYNLNADIFLFFVVSSFVDSSYRALSEQFYKAIAIVYLRH